jgi:signal transduction histidine kinase
MPHDVGLSLECLSDAEIRVDPGRLQQAVLNLALNARDAMHAGGRLSIRLSDSQSDSGASRSGNGSGGPRYVTVALSDTGEGMDAATQRRLFEPFFTTKPQGKGTGLGLLMVRSFVEEAGGSTEVESAPGHGTTVRMRLPRWAGEAAAS